MYKKECVLFSGGFDSAAAALLSPRCDLLFIAYGQSYLDHELKAAQDFASYVSAFLVVHRIPGKDDMKGRNFTFLQCAASYGYSHVTLGVRNPTPLFDKHGDSNWVILNWYANKLGLHLSFPVLCWSKNRVFDFVQENYQLDKLYNCYNNNTDYKTCPCVNCTQRRSKRK